MIPVSYQYTNTKNTIVLITYDDGSIASCLASSLNPLISITACTLLTAQNIQCIMLDNSYNTAMQQLVSYMGYTFQADKDSQDTLNKAITSLQGLIANGGTMPTGFGWNNSSNVSIAMTMLQLQGLAATMMQQIWTEYNHLQTQKAAVRAATDIPTVLSIVW